MIFKNISFLEANQYSPWPQRLLGLTQWQKKKRSTEEILREYNDIWYKKALDLWQSASRTDPLMRPLRFFRLLDEVLNEEIIKNFEVYGVNKDEYLISITQNLFASNYSTINALYENLLINVIEKHIKEYNITTVVELGCGTGGNLFKLYERLPLKRIIGGEICSNAINLGNQILEKCHIEGEFKSFDYCKKNSTKDLTGGISEKYIVFTSHSIEQIQLKETFFVEELCALKHPPEVVIHFEPILNLQNDSLFSQLHQLYAQKNLYNLDVLNVLREYEQESKIKIIDFQEHILGVNAFNPTSILTWKPAK